jgi:hypothetical protein
VLLMVLRSALPLEEGLTTLYDRPCPRHSTLSLSSHLFVTYLSTFIVVLESFNLWSFSIVPRNVSGTDRVPEIFNFFLYRGLWMKSKK